MASLKSKPPLNYVELTTNKTRIWNCNSQKTSLLTSLTLCMAQLPVFLFFFFLKVNKIKTFFFSELSSTLRHRICPTSEESPSSCKGSGCSSLITALRCPRRNKSQLLQLLLVTFIIIIAILITARTSNKLSEMSGWLFFLSLHLAGFSLSRAQQ